MPSYDLECQNGHVGEVILASWQDPNPSCPTCGGTRERLWTLGGRHIGAQAFPYVTKAFDGKPVEVKSETHLKALCNAYGVTHRPDRAWEEKSFSHMARDKNGEWTAVQREGSGRGLPGCW